MTLEAQTSSAFSFNTEPAAPTSKARLWVGRAISGLLIAFFAFDAGCKVLKLPFVLEASAKMGFGADTVFAIGLTLLVCTVLYAIPRTAPLGAVLLTGYLGGAICTHVRNGEGAFPIGFAFTFGVLVWLGLALRDARIHALLAPPRR